MRRALVGFAVLCLITATAAVTGSTPAGAVPGETTVFSANAFSYNAGAIFDGTFCIDGEFFSDPATEEVQGPDTLASGSHQVDFYSSDSVECGVDEPDASDEFVFPDGGTVTLMGWWGSQQRGVSMLVDPLDCIDTGLGRLTVRNGGAVGGSGAVDIYGDGPGGTAQLLISDIAVGDQGTVDLPVGSYTNLTATAAGDPDPVTSIDDIEVTANSSSFAYLYGGNDGGVGSFLGDPEVLDACVIPTTTTAPPAAAPAVEATPAFTG